MSVAVNALQSLQVWATFCGMGSFLTWSGCTRNCRKKPADACHAMWQLFSCQQGLTQVVTESVISQMGVDTHWNGQTPA